MTGGNPVACVSASCDRMACFQVAIGRNGDTYKRKRCRGCGAVVQQSLFRFYSYL